MFWIAHDLSNTSMGLKTSLSAPVKEVTVFKLEEVAKRGNGAAQRGIPESSLAEESRIFTPKPHKLDEGTSFLFATSEIQFWAPAHRQTTLFFPPTPFLCYYLHTK